MFVRARVQTQCPCHELLDTEDRLPEGTVPCYDWRAPLDFRFAAGVYHHGPRKGQPIPMKRTGVGKLAFLTSRRHDASEADRLVIACFRIDGVGAYLKLEGNAVWADPALDFPSETFRVLKEKETARYGEYRTRRLVLEAWARQNRTFTKRGDD